jgi:CheY-like chemotaxis protein
VIKPVRRAEARTIADGLDTPRLCVLIADDEPAIREVQRRLLERAGIDVRLAASGADARDLLLREHVDLVVTDLRMPGEMDGYALLAWLERERPRLAANAIVTTGDVSDVINAATAGHPFHGDRILHKPFEGTEFVNRVRDALALTMR